jgi:hypothetical protein
VIIRLSNRLFLYLCLALAWHIIDDIMSWFYGAYQEDTTIKGLVFPDYRKDEDDMEMVV